MKELRAKRVPPGDRWSIVGGKEVYSSLTELLNAIYKQTQSTSGQNNLSTGSKGTKSKQKQTRWKRERGQNIMPKKLVSHTFLKF